MMKSFGRIERVFVERYKERLLAQVSRGEADSATSKERFAAWTARNGISIIRLVWGQ